MSAYTLQQVEDRAQALYEADHAANKRAFALPWSRRPDYVRQAYRNAAERLLLEEARSAK